MPSRSSACSIASKVAVAGLVVFVELSTAIASDPVSEITLIDERAPLRYKIPTDDGDDDVWRMRQFDDAVWISGILGIGYDIRPFPVDYLPLINTDILVGFRSATNTSAYFRIPFEAPENIASLSLRVCFDDGFVAFINGVEVARANAPGELDFRSFATGSPEDEEAVLFVPFDASVGLGAIRPFEANVLAIHGMNHQPQSTDFLIDLRLDAVVIADPPQPSTPLHIAGVERLESGLCFTLPEEFAGLKIGLEYSRDLESGIWIDIGNFFDIDCATPTFIDPDATRLGRRSGYYRAFLRGGNP